MCIALLALGVFVGIIFGSIPGLTATLGVTLFIPFTYTMQPVQGLVMLIAVYVGGISGGLITATLINIPGTPSSIYTCFDGYPMTKKGKPAQALAIGVFCSLIGGTFSAFALMAIAPQLAKVSLSFGSWEYFAVALMGLSVVVAMCSDSLIKGLIGAGYTFKTPGPASCCIFTVKDSDKPEFVDIAWKLKSMGYKLYGTSGTCAWLNKHMVPCNEVRNMSGEAPNIVDLLQSGLVDYVFSTSAKGRDPKRDSVRLRRKAVELSIPCITAVDTANALVNCLRSDHSMKDIPLVDIATLYHKK